MKSTLSKASVSLCVINTPSIKFYAHFKKVKVEHKLPRGGSCQC